jgi:hypothetical protein
LPGRLWEPATSHEQQAGNQHMSVGYDCNNDGFNSCFHVMLIRSDRQADIGVGSQSGRDAVSELDMEQDYLKMFRLLDIFCDL